MSELFGYTPHDGEHVAAIHGNQFVVMWTGNVCMVAARRAVSMEVSAELGLVILHSFSAPFPVDEADARKMALEALAGLFFDDFMRITGRSDVSIWIDGCPRGECDGVYEIRSNA